MPGNFRESFPRVKEIYMNKEGPLSFIAEITALLGNIVLLNLLFILCALPVITAGASFCGLYHALLKMNRGEGSVVSDFFSGFKSDFLKSTGLWIIVLLFAGGLWGNYIFLSATESFSGWVMAIYLIIGIWTLVLFSYGFPLIAQFENKLFPTIRNALLLGITNVNKTLLMLIINLAFPVLLLLFTEVFLRVLVFFLALGFSLPAYFNSLILNKIFKPFLPDSSGENDSN